MTEDSGGGGGSATPSLDADALLASIPNLDGRGLEAQTIIDLPSAHLTLADQLEICRAARDARAPRGRRRRHPRHRHAGGDRDALRRAPRRRGADRLHRRDPPRLGRRAPTARRTPSTPSASPPARPRPGWACWSCFGGEIHHARCARKTDTTSLVAFSSPQTGPLGRVTEGHPTIWSRIPRNPPLDPPDLDRRVARRRRPAAGDDGALARAALATEPDGAVIGTLGAGHLHAGSARALGATPPSGSRSSPTAAPSAA